MMKVPQISQISTKLEKSLINFYFPQYSQKVMPRESLNNVYDTFLQSFLKPIFLIPYYLDSDLNCFVLFNILFYYSFFVSRKTDCSSIYVLKHTFWYVFDMIDLWICEGRLAFIPIAVFQMNLFLNKSQSINRNAILDESVFQMVIQYSHIYSEIFCCLWSVHHYCA